MNTKIIVQSPNVEGMVDFDQFEIGEFLIAPQSNLGGQKIGPRAIRFSGGGECDDVSPDTMYFRPSKVEVFLTR